MVPHLRRVLDTSGIEPVVIHPARVYEPDGGVFRRFVPLNEMRSVSSAERRCAGHWRIAKTCDDGFNQFPFGERRQQW
jgi:hypothetical protein